MLIGLLTIWYSDFFGAQTVAVLPYKPVLEAISGLSAAVGDGEQWRTFNAAAERGRSIQLRRSTRVSREQMANTPSIS